MNLLVKLPIVLKGCQEARRIRKAFCETKPCTVIDTKDNYDDNRR